MATKEASEPKAESACVSTINSLRRRLNLSATQIKAINEQGRKALKDSDSISLFKAMFKRLDFYLNRFEETWELLADGSEAIASPFPSLEDQSLYDGMHRYYYEANSTYDSVNRAGETSTSNATSDKTLRNQSSTSSHLPSISIPHFNGEITKWPAFRDVFSSLVHNDESIPSITKMHYLTTALSGQASAVIRHLPLEGDSYALAWDALKSTYENNRLLASSYLNALLSLSEMPKQPSIEVLNEYLTKVSESVAAFRHLKIEAESDFMLYHLAARGLDSATVETFELDQGGNYPKIEDFLRFVRDRVKAHQAVDAVWGKRSKKESGDHGSSFKQRGMSKYNKSLFSQSSAKESTGPMSCPVCSQNHRIFCCPTFCQASSDKRFTLIKDWTGCRNCLGFSHTDKDCKSKRGCRVCGKRHHTLLHKDKGLSHQQRTVDAGSSLQQSPVSNKTPSEGASSLASSNHNSRVVLGTALAEIEGSNGVLHTARLVLDSGSQNSFITVSLAQRLGFPLRQCNTRISGIGQTTLREPMGLTPCTITPRGSKEPKLTTKAITVETITGLLPQTSLPSFIAEGLVGCTLADPEFCQPSTIDLLIGADLFPQIMTGTIKAPWPSGPYLLPTIFGDVIMGPISGTDIKRSSTTLFSSERDHLDNQLKKFWELEESVTTVDELDSAPEVEEHFRTTHTRNSEGRYVVRLPFIGSPPTFCASEKIALNRFLNLEGKLKRDPERRVLYTSFMEEYRMLQHMSLTTEESRYVIPHHSVFKEGNIRVVFDASAITDAGSLNDHLHVGPKLQKDIGQILMSFRCHQIAFTADISKMYRQILLATEDRAFQHIFWRSHPSHRVMKYQLNTLTYGLASAPYLAQRTILQLCQDEGSDFPEASSSLRRDMYVDDLLTGASTIEDAIKLRDQAVSLLRRGGFELGKWCSNDPRLTETISNTRTFGEAEATGVKILGLLWNPIQDVFSYSLAPPVGTIITKRSILSTVARIFDPLGFLAPVVFKAKSFLQALWKDKRDWDETLEGDTAKLWTSFIQELPQLADVKIPRLVFSTSAASYRIVGFSDASMKGYSATIYLVVTDCGHSRSFLLTAKTKLAPMKTISVPRLELQGALLLARTFKGIQSFIASIPEHLCLPPYFLTDSRIVLHWIQTPCHRLKIFVGNRISEIISLTPCSRWFHVPSEENPSDLSSRGVMPGEISELEIWWKGPSWLVQPESCWRISALKEDMKEPGYTAELHQPLSLLVATNQEDGIHDWIKRFSSFRTLINSFAYVLRFIQNSSKRGNHRDLLSVEEREIATNTLIRIVQRHHYPNLGTTKELHRLNPFLDSHGILRVGGRLLNSSVSYSLRHPIILPGKEHFTYIFVDHIHEVYLHPSLDLSFSIIQSKYWIPGLRRLIRRRTSLCITCYKFNSSKKQVTPFMGNLPAPRVSPGRAFDHVGVDFAGPFQLRISKLRKAPSGKAYLCLFVCLATRALHLELVSDLTTEAFLASFSRFCSRRGMPSDVYSDCGTNFVGAARELKELFKWHHEDTVRKRIATHATDKGIRWHFNPPGAPHFGGLWETGVRSVKAVIRKVANDHALTFEEWTTLLTRIEAILNSRPLCSLPPEQSEYGYLTPAHFLIGRTLLEPPTLDLSDQPTNRLSRWELITKMQQYFWKRWSHDYLTTLQERQKWTNHIPNLSVGDFVLMKDDKSHPLNWQHGRIVETFPGNDGISRVAVVQTPTTTVRRPAAKLIPLSPLQQDPFS